MDYLVISRLFYRRHVDGYSTKGVVMISVSDEIKLRADIATQLTKNYDNIKRNYTVGNWNVAIERANEIVDDAIKSSLNIVTK